jgi:hypothetical protein
MDEAWNGGLEPPTREQTRQSLLRVLSCHAGAQAGLQACRQLARSVERWWMDHPVVVPRWSAPLALANLALFVVFRLDHQSTYPHPLLVLAGVGALLILFAAIGAATVRAKGRPLAGHRRIATLVLLVAMAANTAFSAILVLPHLAQAQRYATDAAAATDCGATLFIQGRNPYDNLHMLTCLQRHGLGPGQTTPRQAGTFWVFATYPSPITAHFQYLLYKVYWRDLRHELRDPLYRPIEFETRFNYPGGALLIAALALLAGCRDLVPLYLACALAASLLIYRRSPRRIRPVLGLLLLGNTPLLLDEVGGTTDSLYGLILVLYWQCRTRALLAGLLLGLGTAIRQQVWFFLPFLLYLGWRGGGRADLARRAGGTLAAFLACNLPFIAAGPGAWLTGVLGPMRDPLLAEGVGFVSLSLGKILPLWPSRVYGGLELLLFILAFACFTRWCAVAPGLAMVLPLLPLVFAWRSLHTYFLLLPLLAAAVLADRQLRTAATAPSPCSGAAWLGDDATLSGNAPSAWGTAIPRTRAVGMTEVWGVPVD